MYSICRCQKSWAKFIPSSLWFGTDLLEQTEKGKRKGRRVEMPNEMNRFVSEKVVGQKEWKEENSTSLEKVSKFDSSSALIKI